MAESKLRLSPGGVLTQAFATEARHGWPAVAGEVRPALAREVEQHRDALARSKDAARAQAEFYAAHIKSWDIEAPDGAPQPVTPDAVLALPYPVWAQLEGIVLGSGGGEVLGNGPR